jgi:ligand-binding sensor domain-containing protein
VKVLFSLLLFLGNYCFGQSNNRIFHQFEPAKLPGPFVIDLLTDRDGFLWIATRGGLSRFDGENYITYQHDPDDSNSLSNSYIRCLLEDNN